MTEALARAGHPPGPPAPGTRRGRHGRRGVPFDQWPQDRRLGRPVAGGRGERVRRPRARLHGLHAHTLPARPPGPRPGRGATRLRGARPLPLRDPIRGADRLARTWSANGCDTRSRSCGRAVPDPPWSSCPRTCSRCPSMARSTTGRCAPARPAPDEGAVHEAAELLLAATTPLIWAGQGLLYSEGSDGAGGGRRAARRPGDDHPPGQERHARGPPLSAGIGGYAQTPMVEHTCTQSDVLLVVGSSLSRTDFTPEVPAGKTIIHVTIDPVDLNKTHSTGCPCPRTRGCSSAALATESARPCRATGTQRPAATTQTLQRRGPTGWPASSRFRGRPAPIDGYRMFRELWALLDPTETIITHESGSSRDIQSVFYTSTRPRGYLGWGQSTQLGYSIGGAMGARSSRIRTRSWSTSWATPPSA